MLDLPVITHEHIMIGWGDLGDIDVNIAEHMLNAMKSNPSYSLVSINKYNKFHSLFYSLIMKKNQ